MKIRTKVLTALWLSLALLLSVRLTLATTILTLGLEELVAESSLIFTGEVQQSSVSVENDLVYTTVAFAIDELIKGEYAQDVLTLRFLGGESTDVKIDIAGQFIPAPGERGLYFVQDVQRDLVNPLTGWSQGYFPLIEDPGGIRYLDLRNHPAYELILGKPDPLAEKMRAMQFPADRIDARFPDSHQFPLADMVEVIRDVLRQQGE